MYILGSVLELVLLTACQGFNQDIQNRSDSVWMPSRSVCSHVPTELIEQDLCGTCMLSCNCSEYNLCICLCVVCRYRCYHRSPWFNLYGNANAINSREWTSSNDVGSSYHYLNECVLNKVERCCSEYYEGDFTESLRDDCRWKSITVRGDREVLQTSRVSKLDNIRRDSVPSIVRCHPSKSHIGLCDNFE